MRVIDIACREPVTVGPDDRLEYAATLMHERNVRHLPVTVADRVVGMLSDRDVKAATGDPTPAERRSGYADKPWMAAARWRTVGSAMSFPVAEIGPDDDPADAARMMLRQGVGALAVVDGGRFLGLLTETDILRAYLAAAADAECEETGSLVCCKLAAGNVIDVMTVDPVTVRPDEPVGRAVDAMADHGIRHLPVTEDGRLVGMLSDRDICRALGRSPILFEAVGPAGAPGRRNAGTAVAGLGTVRDFMSPDPVVIGIDAALDDAARMMIAYKVSGLPVVELGRPVGIVTAADILGAFIALETA
jgi:acetoin utilization protein AcuB